jgi:imidazolonepropionase-like amidohydrolase
MRALLIAALFAGGAAVAEPLSTAYRDVTLIDGLGGPARPGMTLVVEGERLAAVLPNAAFDASGSPAKMVEMAGAFAAPGLIDTHVHLATVPDRARAERTLRRQVYSGVTAVRDMAGDGRAMADLARSARLGAIPAPDIRYAALMAGPSFFDDPRPKATAQGAVAGDVPWMQAITDETDLARAVARGEGTTASGIKIYSDLPARLIAPIVAESHRQGLKVWSHAAIFPTRPSEVIETGVDVISHACLLEYEFAEPMPRRYASPRTADFEAPAARVTPLLEQMRRKGTLLDATLFAYAKGGFDAEGSPNRVIACPEARAAEITALAFKAGVPITAGTDGETPPDAPFPALLDELELLQLAGIPPIEVMRAASLNGARAIGDERERGTLEPGKLADIVFLAEDPTRDVRAFRSIRLTVKRGAPYPREAYAP